MAAIAVALSYELTLPRATETSTLETDLKPDLGVRTDYDFQLKEKVCFLVEMTVKETKAEIAIELLFLAKAEKTSLWAASSAIKPMALSLRKRVKDAIERWASGKSAWTYDEGRPSRLVLAKALMEAESRTTVSVPLLGSDRDVLITDAGATRAVEASIRERYPFQADQNRLVAAVEMTLAYDSLLIDASDAEIAVSAGESYLNATRRQAQPREAVPATPVWAWASAGIALTSVGLSFLSLHWITLALFAVVVLAGAGAAVVLSPRFSVRKSTTALGLVPILTLCVFAFVYGMVALLDPSAIASYGTRLHYLRDPLLLSLSLLSTVGVFDLNLHGWVRSLAYLEMLLIAGLAGGAAIVAFRRISRRARALLDELRVERG